MGAKKVLVVDDDQDMLILLRSVFEKNSYTVFTAPDGLGALRELERAEPDLMILDVNLPLLDGLEVCRQIREKSNLPILMLSSHSSEFYKIQGLDSGADDYLAKPFSPSELMARVRALLRRAATSGPELKRDEVLVAGCLRLELSSHLAWDGSSQLSLTPNELCLLEALIRCYQKTVSRAKLLEAIWGTEYASGLTRTVDTHIGNLRQKLSAEAPVIESVRGVGFKLMPRPG